MSPKLATILSLEQPYPCQVLSNQVLFSAVRQWSGSRPPGPHGGTPSSDPIRAPYPPPRKRRPSPPPLPSGPEVHPAPPLRLQTLRDIQHKLPHDGMTAIREGLKRRNWLPSGGATIPRRACQNIPGRQAVGKGARREPLPQMRRRNHPMERTP